MGHLSATSFSECLRVGLGFGFGGVGLEEWIMDGVEGMEGYGLVRIRRTVYAW
jgi:hypothetical protein